MDIEDPATQRRVGLVANAVGLVLLAAFIAFGNRLFDDATLGWVTFGVAVVLTGLGIILLQLSNEAAG